MAFTGVMAVETPSLKKKKKNPTMVIFKKTQPCINDAE